MNQESLADREWNAPVWGNYQTNIEFLRRVGVFDTHLTILEVGCGKGLLLKTLHEAGHTVVGIDSDADPIAVCRTLHPELTVEVASGDSIPFPTDSFDAVVSFDVFEHIRDTERHLREVARVLKPGASYLLQTPNKWTNIPFELLRQWTKYRIGPVAGYRKMLKEHCALHNYWQLRRRFAQSGFTTTLLDIPVVNDYFINKLHTYLGALASPALTILNPDRLPQPLRTNFYVKAQLIH